MKKILLLLLSIFCITTTFANTTHYIIDTDMGFDDWLAVLYLLKQPIAIDAITIDCQGETRCPEGAVNAEKLTHLAKRDVPIAYGKSRPPSTYDFPALIRDYASDMSVPGFLNLQVDHDETKLSAAQIIYSAVIYAAKQHDTVVIISIGTATNINDAWKIAEKNHLQILFRQGLAMIVKGGGAFGAIENGQLSNQSIPGNITIPNIITSKNTVAEWNIYANAPAMCDLLDANLPITFVPNNATDAVPMTKKVANALYASGDENGIRRFNANAMFALFKMQGTTKNLDFWDTAVTISALHPYIVTKIMKNVPVKIILKPGNYYGATWFTPTSRDNVTVYYKINKALFYKALLQGI